MTPPCYSGKLISSVLKEITDYPHAYFSKVNPGVHLLPIANIKRKSTISHSFPITKVLSQAIKIQSHKNPDINLETRKNDSIVVGCLFPESLAKSSVSEVDRKPEDTFLLFRLYKLKDC